MRTMENRRLLIEKKQELVSIEMQFNGLKQEPSTETKARVAFGQLFMIPGILGLIGLLVAQITLTDWRGNPILDLPMFFLLLLGFIISIVIGSAAIKKSNLEIKKYEVQHKELTDRILILKRSIIELENMI